MLSSIGVQHGRWTQISQLQPSPQVQPTLDGGVSQRSLGKAHAGAAATELPPVNPITGGTGSPLGGDTTFLLTVFGSAVHHRGSQTGATGSAAGPSPNEQVAQGQQQVTTQSDVTGRAGAAASDGITGTSLVQVLQALVSPGVSPTSERRDGRPPLPTQPGPVTSRGPTANRDTAPVSSQNGRDSPPVSGDGWRQQAGLAAYVSGAASERTNATGSVLQGLTA